MIGFHYDNYADVYAEVEWQHRHHPGHRIEVRCDDGGFLVIDLDLEP